MSIAAAQAMSPAEIALAYHKRTKHSLKRYAAGPETLDWDTQPNPFREFTRSARTDLELGADRLTPAPDPRPEPAAPRQPGHLGVARRWNRPPTR